MNPYEHVEITISPISVTVGKTILNHPFGHGLYHLFGIQKDSLSGLTAPHPTQHAAAESKRLSANRTQAVLGSCSGIQWFTTVNTVFFSFLMGE